MKNYRYIKRSPFFKVLHGLNKENLSDHKVGILNEIDMSSAVRLRRRLEVETGIRPSYTALVIKAISMALREHPHANRVPIGPWFWKRFVELDDVDMSVAVERDRPGVEQAVFAGTIRGTDGIGLTEITQELRALANATHHSCPRWRQFEWICRKLPSWLALRVLTLPRMSARLWIEHRGGCVLVSSPAKYGVDLMIGAWPWPLGFSFGYIKERSVVRGGELCVAPTMTLTLSFDRRMMGGAPSARFFKTVCDLLEDAEHTLQSRGADTRSTEDVVDIASQRAVGAMAR